MVDKKKLKEEKEKKKGQKSESSLSSVWLMLGVVAAGMVVAMPQLMTMAKQKKPLAAAQPPVQEIKLSFAEPPEARPEQCPRGLQIRNGKETVSIIIPYLNEEWFRIEATMQSIIKYTDLSLVREIVWVSDGNKREMVFRSELEAMHPLVSVHENRRNLGLIKTKMEAVTRAKGSVLMFLEPHVVTNAGWLEPLLSRLNEEPKALIMPALDALGEDLSYHPSGRGHWRFEWNLNLIFTNPADEQALDKPYLSPATSGGIYAIRKDWWDKLQLFDPELLRWGGDHVEASHKVWRCGGRIEVHPCSRIGHWFREPEQRPYAVKVESVVRNYKRLAEVWFDNYKEHFYKVKPEARNIDIGNISEMVDRRKSLGVECKDMKWYIRNVDVELGWEADKICIPGMPGKDGGCGKSTIPAHRRSTILEAVTKKEYQRLVASAEGHRPPRDPCCRAIGRGCKRICGPGETPTNPVT